MALHPGPENSRVPHFNHAEVVPIRQAFHDNEDWYQDLVENSQDLLCLHDLKGRLLSLNPAPARALGYSVEEILQIPMRELIAPEFRSQFEDYLKQIAIAGEARGFLAIMTRAGERRIWEYRNTLRTEGVTSPIVRGMARDVTEQKRAEKLLYQANQDLQSKVQESEGIIRELKLFRSLLDRSNDSIHVVDPESLRFLDINQKACSQLGYRREELLALKVWDIDPVINKESLANVKRGLRQMGFVTMESLHRRKDGSTFPVEVHLARVHIEKDYVVAVARDLTKRKQNEERLREYERVVEGLEEKILVVDREYRYVIANRAFLCYMGVPRAQVIGRTVSEVLDPDTFAAVIKPRMDECFEGKIVQYELKYKYPNKEERDLFASYFPIEGPSGIDRIACILQDITEHKRTEEKLAAQSVRLQILSDASKAFAEVEQDYQSVLNEVARQVAAVLADICLVRLLSEDGETLDLAAVHGMGWEQSQALCALVHSTSEPDDTAETSARVIHTGKPVFVPESTPDQLRARMQPAQWEIYQECMPRSYIVVPLRSQGRQIGVLSLIRHRAERPAFSPEDLSLAQDLADRAALAISNAGLLARVQDELDERKRAEAALRASEENYRLFVEQSSEGIFREELDVPLPINMPEDELAHHILHDHYMAECNDAMAAMYGFTSGRELLGKRLTEMVVAEDPRNIELTREFIRGGFRVIDRKSHEVDIRGNPKVFLNSMIGIVENAMLVRTWGIQKDVTETVKLEQARKQAEEELRNTVIQLCEVTSELGRAKEKLSEEKLYLEEAIDTELGFGEIVGRSSALKRVMEKVAKVAPSDATVLLLGETGTGKELMARALHRLSNRQNSSFIKMNCAAIPSGLLESELFGYEKGAFTGAVGRKLGRLELADEGTLFLDEIGEIPINLQPKLLRALQDMEFERLGGTQTLKVNFRLLAATNRDLLQSVKQREFRSDLYYRLNVFPILIPPLRERREDIRPLIEHYVRKFAGRMKKSITSIPAKTMELLVRWDWPGNIRELENFVERSVILTPGSVLQSPLSELSNSADSGDAGSDTLRDRERENILRALRDCHGQLGGPEGAAALLGLKRTTLQSKLDQLGIKPAAFR